MMLDIPLDIPLTARHLRFHIRALTPIVLGRYTGSALRGALATALRATFCPASAETKENPLHLQLCPVCRLLALENDGSIDGDIRRPYALEPDVTLPSQLDAGDRWHFDLAIYGEDRMLFQFLLLTVGGMGDFGLGRKGDDGRRGRFVVETIENIQPITNACETILASHEHLVQEPTLLVEHPAVMATADALHQQLVARDNQLQIQFLTPTRIMQKQHTIHKPDFFPLAKALTQRILDLAAQFGEGRPTWAGAPFSLKEQLYPYADAVQLVGNQTRWWDIKGYSSRIDRKQVLGGLVGEATYVAPDWRPLLPWLVWGMSTHVGKNAVKGCGLYRLRVEP